MEAREITQEYLVKKFDYDSITGEFTFKECSHKHRIGTRAGCIHHSGYRFINLFGKGYAEHRLAWIYMFGKIPTEMIDHIDGNKSNNCISNLRCATRSNNTANATLRKDSTSGVKGVNWHTVTGKWMCRVQSNKLRIILGYFDTIEAAELAAKNYRESVHKEFTNHGDSYDPNKTAPMC